MNDPGAREEIQDIRLARFEGRPACGCEEEA